MCHINVKSVRR